MVGVALSMPAAVAVWGQADYGFDFVTIGDAGNLAYSGPDPTGFMIGRGSVGYDYRIARMEVTTSQWLDFVNTFTTREDASVGLGFLPVFWGATIDNDYQGPGLRWRIATEVPGAAVLPVAGIGWRTAARYANWLHNGQSSELQSLDGGAYDTSTWGFVPGQGYTDAERHEPDARFWIPTVDEWLKAAHYDPNRYGPGQGGYWNYTNTSDEVPVPGLPGEGETMAGLDLPGFAEWLIPLGAYPQTRSPWGLLDTTGGTSEQVEDWLFGNEGFHRWHDGHYAGAIGDVSLDDIRYPGSSTPASRPAEVGLRVASQVPSGSLGVLFTSLSLVITTRRQRRCDGTR